MRHPSPPPIAKRLFFRLNDFKVSLIDLKDSFWLIPLSLIVFGIAFGVLAVNLDETIFADLNSSAFWLFGGRSDAARDLLSSIASSVITVVAVAFSITIVAIQQAATQYSPRVLKRFTSDRINQWVLGVYMGTFAFSLIVLRSVRSANESAGSSNFIPAFSVTMALLLALVSIGLLVIYIHHITRSLQVTTIITGIRKEFDSELSDLYPEELTEAVASPPSYEEEMARHLPRDLERATHIPPTTEGHVRYVDTDELFDLTKEMKDTLLWVHVSVGDYVTPFSPAITVWSTKPLDPLIRTRLQSAVAVASERSIHQDPLYAIQQIVDVAVKALSPSVNDPTTAEQCISQLQGAFIRLMLREIPPAYTRKGEVKLIVKRPDLPDYLDLGFDSIWRYSEGAGGVAMRLIRCLEEILRHAPNAHRREFVLRKLRQYSSELEGMDFRAPIARELQALIGEAVSTGVSPLIQTPLDHSEHRGSPAELH